VSPRGSRHVPPIQPVDKPSAAESGRTGVCKTSIPGSNPGGASKSPVQIQWIVLQPVAANLLERQGSRAIANVTVVHGGILQPPSEGERRGASYEVAVSALAVPTCRCAPWDPMDDRHYRVVRSASFTVGALGGILTRALGARAIAAERPQGVLPTHGNQKGQTRRR